LNKKILIGTVIFFIAVPFLFSDTVSVVPAPHGAKAGISIPSWSYLPKLALFTKTVSFDFNLRLVQVEKHFLADSLRDSTFTTVKIDSSKTSTAKKEKQFKMRKSPLVATLLSAVIPGAGQFYNQSYWKIPVIGALVGYFGYEYFHYNNIFKDYRDRYAASQVLLPPEGDDNLKIQREFYHNQRDDFVWYFMIVYVVNLVDAYVDAHLFDFDVSEEKILTTGIIDRKAELKLHINF